MHYAFGGLSEHRVVGAPVKFWVAQVQIPERASDREQPQVEVVFENFRVLVQVSQLGVGRIQLALHPICPTQTLWPNIVFVTDQQGGIQDAIAQGLQCQRLPAQGAVLG